MSGRELHPANYRRISLINWVLTPPLLFLFSWPYLFLAEIIEMPFWFLLAGALSFSLPFAITILHGHVTMALGSVHRDYYYQWLQSNPYTYGLFYHPVWIRTRFRLSLFYLSIVLFLAGYLFH